MGSVTQRDHIFSFGSDRELHSRLVVARLACPLVLAGSDSIEGCDSSLPSGNEGQPGIHQCLGVLDKSCHSQSNDESIQLLSLHLGHSNPKPELTRISSAVGRTTHQSRVVLSVSHRYIHAVRHLILSWLHSSLLLQLLLLLQSRLIHTVTSEQPFTFCDNSLLCE